MQGSISEQRKSVVVNATSSFPTVEVQYIYQAHLGNLPLADRWIETEAWRYYSLSSIRQNILFY